MEFVGLVLELWSTGSVWKVLEGFAEKFSKDLDEWIFFENSAKLVENAIFKSRFSKMLFLGLGGRGVVGWG